MRNLLVEIWKADGGGLIASVDAHACPDVGEKINILGENWLVRSRSWCLDYSDMAHSEQRMRVCLNCEPTDDALPDAAEDRQASDDA